MSDCDMGCSADTGYSAPAEDCSRAPETSMDCSNSAPRTDYETCVSDTVDTNRYSYNCNPISEYGQRYEADSLYDIRHDTTVHNPFLDAAQELDYQRHRDVSRFSQYSARQSYKPSYTMKSTNTPRRHVYRDTTHAINRLNKVQHRFNTRDDTEILCRNVFAVIAGFIIVVVVVVTTSIYLHRQIIQKYGQGSKRGESLGTIYSVPDFSETDESMMNALRNVDKSVDDPIFKSRDYNTNKRPLWNPWSR